MKERCNQCWQPKDLKGYKNCASCRRRKRLHLSVGRPTELDTPGPTKVMWNECSKVQKLGGIPASTSSGHTCPDACELKGNGCYAEFGIGGAWWRALSAGGPAPRGSDIGISWREFLDRVRALPRGQLWRHNLAGDLPGDGDRLAGLALRQLVAANVGKRGFTFTHKPLKTRHARGAISVANRRGFTINLSADSLRHADELAGLEVGPVAVVLPEDASVRSYTPKGREVLVCPAQRDERATCRSCGWCSMSDRKWVVGFRAHGQMKKAISLRVVK